MTAVTVLTVLAVTGVSWALGTLLGQAILDLWRGSY